MAYSFDAIFAADPNNPEVVAANAAILIYDPADAGKAPLTITDSSGSPLANPITVSKNGFGPSFLHATLDRVAWQGGGFEGFMTSYEGMKNEAVAARVAAEAAAVTAGAEASAAATASLSAAVTSADTAATSATTAASAASTSAAAAAASAALVGAPADAAIAAAINGTGATKTALSATYGLVYNVRSAEFGAAGDGAANDRPSIQAALDAAYTAGGGIVYIPEGSYKLGRASDTTTELLTVRDRVTLRGAGKDKTKLFIDPTTPTSTTGLVGIRIGTATANVANVTVEHLELTMNTSIINNGVTPANQLWGIGARFDVPGDSPATALLHSDNITVRHCRVLDSRIAITFAKASVTTAVNDDYLSRNLVIEDNYVDGIWNRSIEVAFATNVGIRRNVIRGRGFLHILAYCYMVWVEENDIEYGRDAYSMTGTVDKPGASTGPAGVYLSTGIYNVWFNRNNVRAHPFASTAIAGCVQFRTEQWAVTLDMHDVLFTDNRWSNTTATTKRVLDFNTQSSVVSNTIRGVRFLRDYFEGVVKLYGGTNATLHLDDWTFDTCTLTEPIDTVAHATVDVDDVKFIRSKLAGAQVPKLTNAEFHNCVFPGTLTLDASSANVEATSCRTASGAVTNSGTGNTVTGTRTLLV